MREDGETRTLRSRALQGTLLLGDGAGAEKQRSVADWEMGQWGQGGDKRDRPSCPSYLTLVMPHHGSSPQARSFPLGTIGGSGHWPGS